MRNPILVEHGLKHLASRAVSDVFLAQQRWEVWSARSTLRSVLLTAEGIGREMEITIRAALCLSFVTCIHGVFLNDAHDAHVYAWAKERSRRVEARLRKEGVR